MGMIKNVTEGIYPFQPYQQALYDKIQAGGFKRGEMALYYSAGRQTGKSTLNQMYGKLWNNNLCKEILLPMKPALKYKFSRSKWHEVHLMFKSYDPIQERLDWCEQTFGPQPKQPDAWSRWYTSFTTLRFRDEKDYHWFILRWGI